MSSLDHTRRSRRLSRKAPVEVADYDWQGAASLQLLHSGSDVDIKPPTINPSSPSLCTSTSSDSPPPIVTHLPFTPGSSHTRNRKEGHIPRPPNAFMVFRSWLWNKDNLKSIERDNRNVSRIAGRCWHELSEAERAPFRSMAEEAKARHAQLYPEYRYSPGSQKKPKVTQRRSQRSVEVENAKCDKVVDLLLGSVTSRDLAKRLGEEDKPTQGALAMAGEGRHSELPNATPRNKRKRIAAPRGKSPPPQPRSKKQKTFLPSPPISTPSSQHFFPLPVLTATKEMSEPAPTPQLLARTPELVYLPDVQEVFVPTDDIPYLSLDGCNYSMGKSEDQDPPIFPSHLKPGAHSVFAGIKPEATSFVDSCMLGAYTADTFGGAAPIPFTDFDIVESYSSSDIELVPLGSPVFTNPFEPSISMAEHAALLGTLDQLFGQPISPLTQVFPTENW